MKKVRRCTVGALDTPAALLGLATKYHCCYGRS